MTFVKPLLDFIEKSPTAFHAVENICSELEASGRTRLTEGEKWALEPGRGYFVTRNMSSVIAFDIPEGEADSFRMIAAHSDSPTFKIKENAELSVRGKYTQLNVEKYGGMLFSPWFDRPLSVAGRVVVRTEKGVEARLINVDRDLLVIPNVAIHMNREINDGFKYNAQTDMMPLFGDDTAKDGFKKLIAETAGVPEEDLLGTDLFLYPRIKPAVIGNSGEYIMSPRLDDLECAWSGLRAFIDAEKPDRGINMLCVFDNEEVGSGTKQGADSTFLYDVMQRICISLGLDPEASYRAAASSFMLSADNAHAVHPNHPEKTDAENCVFMNEGIVIKFNANQRYTTDGVSAAFFHKLLKDADVPCQHFANRSDVAGGGTLGNISGSHVSINTLDIGLAQLAMHSVCETAGAKDVEYMVRGMAAFYASRVSIGRDGEFILG
ncbi:MAG: M18 family aminopeptidase [Clostridia bacterium]|nr:M18 family aminopeptidase [Clostridia bacterium]MBR3487539.1 M18 family aminopeptidase [Clostridia bacterium]